MVHNASQSTCRESGIVVPVETEGSKSGLVCVNEVTQGQFSAVLRLLR
jgi:hypothetical protein